MTTATGEYAHLPSQFSALSIADAAPREELPGGDNGGGAVPAPRKAWRSPPRRAFAEEPRSSSSWPAPSRDGALGRKKPPPQRSLEVAAAALSAPSSPVESAPSGDPDVPMADPREQLQMEKGAREERPRGSDSAAVAPPRADPAPPVANSNPRAARPPLLPVPRHQQGRPPQNGRRGRVPYHQNNGDHSGSGNGGSHQQRRPRQQWNTVFPHQQPPAQFVNENFYHPMNQPMMGFPNLPPDWGFNPMPILQWGPNPHLAPPYMGTLAPPVGPRFAEVFPYHSPLPPMPPPPPPPGWNPSWFIPAPPEATLQNQPQTPGGSTQPEGEDVGARLRKQIEYYFSNENLMKDIYLRKCMDNQGWVSVHTIADFPRIRSLTRDVGLVLGALQTSDTVEVSVDKMRRKGEWNKWIIREQLPDANQEAPGG